MPHLKQIKEAVPESTGSTRHDNIHQIDCVDEIVSHGKEKHIIILPLSMKIPFAINHHVAESNYYVEYLHWNNKGILDGFLDHKNNLVLLNDEYVLRKEICSNLFNIYKSDDFIWSN